ncbi:MAG: transporter, family, inner rane transport protein [Cryptosporangiaceae bacterium]|nr:transporter, family, inner rane transport protein [Cryptosporangiaceae bacterium]
MTATRGDTDPRGPVAASPEPPAPAGRLGPALAALAVGGFGIGTTEFATMGLLPDLARHFHASIPVMGHGITAYALGVVVGAPVIAVLGARLPRRGMLIGLMAAFAIGNALSAAAPTAGLFSVARFAAGLPHGAFFGIAAVVAASLAAPDRRGRAVSLAMIGLTIANIAGVPAATAIGQLFGWRAAYAGVAVIGLLTMAAVRLWVPALPAAAGAGIRRELGALRRPQVWFALVTGMIGFGGMFSLYSYIAPTMTQVAGVPPAGIAWVLAVFGTGMTGGALFGGRLVDRSALGTVCGTLGTVAVLLAVFALTARHAVAAIALVFVLGATTTILANALQVRLMEASPDAPSLAASSSHAALNVANAAGAWLGGLVIAAGWGLLATAWVGVALSLGGLAVALASAAAERRTGAAER